jgi:hypothetical protein
MVGLSIGHVMLFFSFRHGGEKYSCALLQWLVPCDKDPDTGMWVVQPKYEGNECCTLSIITLDCIARAVHLLPVYGTSFLPEYFHFSDSLDVF